MAPARSQSLDTQISRLINQGRFDEAQALFEANAPSEADRHFFVGRLLKSQGLLIPAIASFQMALEREPGHLNARRELTHSLVIVGRFSDAQLNLDILGREDLTPSMQPIYAGFQRLIDENKPAGASASFALVPSSNINRGTSETVFETSLGSGLISEDSRETSGLGVRVGLHGFLRNRLSERLRLVLKADLWATKYSEKAFDTLQAKLTAMLEGRSERLRWSLAPYLRQDWSREEIGPSLAPDERFTASLRAVGAELKLQFFLDEANSVQLGVLTEDRRYPVSGFQDGRYNQVRIDYARRLADDLTFGLGLALNTGRPEPAHLRYDGTELNASIRKIFSGTVDTSFGLAIGHRAFEGDYPLRTTPRNDDYWRINLGYRNADWSVLGSVPSFTCSYTRAHSNIEFFDYDVSECQLAFERRF